MNTKTFGIAIIIIALIGLSLGIYMYNSVSKISYGNMSVGNQAIMSVLTNNEVGRNQNQIAEAQKTGTTIMTIAGFGLLLGIGVLVSSKTNKN